MGYRPGLLHDAACVRTLLAVCLAAGLLLIFLAGCAEDPAGPSDALPAGEPQPDPVQPVWDPADFAHVYEVGPGQAYAAPGDVPWEALAPSSLVLIHWRQQPYSAKWVINTAGTADDPVVVLGVPVDGQRPVISGDGAVTRSALNYWNEVRSVIKVGGSNLPSDDIVPAHVTIQSLDIRSGRPPYTFTDDAGSEQTYSENAAAVHIEIGEHITVYDCLIHDSGNGLFVSSPAVSVTIAGNHVYDNGIEGSIYHHNSYTECRGITFEYNFYGPLRDGCLGNNLKDRSAGTVIRYNRIESGNRQLDLVETDHDALLNDPGYDVTFVYGNLLIEPDGAGNSQIVHYGGDGGDTSNYRRGTLYFYHNTVVSTRSGNTTLLRCATSDVTVDARNNILTCTAPGSNFAVSSGRGQITLTTNWLPQGWRWTHEATFDGVITTVENLEGGDPQLVDLTAGNYRPLATSPCATAAGPNAAGADTYPVTRQYVHPCGLEVRTVAALGALEAD